MDSGSTELEKLVVKLVADATQFTAPLAQAQKDVQATAAVIQQTSKQAMVAMRRSMQDAVTTIQSILTPQEKYSRELKKLDKLLDEGYLSQTYYNRALEKAYDAYQKTTPAAVAWQKSLKQANQTQQQATQLLQQMQSPAQRQAQQMAQLNNYYQRGIINAQQYQQALAGVAVQGHTVAQSMNFVHNGLANVSRMFTRTGIMLTAGLTAPITAFGAAGVYEFGQFDDAMTRSLANAEQSEERFRGQMEATAMSISNNGINSAVGLAGAYYELITAGLTAQESMYNLATVDKFATSAKMDLLHATNMLNNAQTSIGLRDFNDPAKNAANMKRVADVIMKASVMTQISPEDISRSLVTKSGAQARLLGKDIEETVAAISAFGMQGVKAELAGEQLYILWRDMQRAAIENKDAWKALGVEAFDPLTGELKSTAVVVAGLTNLLKPLSDEQKAITMATLGFTDRSSAATKILLGTSEAMSHFENELRTAQGSLDDIHNRTLKSFINQMRITWNQVRNVGIEIGARLAPYLLKMGEAVRWVVSWWHKLDDKGKAVTIVIGAIVAAIGPAVVLMGSLIGVASMVAAAIGAIAMAGWPVVLAVAAVTAGVVVFTAEVVAMLAALGTGYGYFYGPKSFSQGFDKALRIMARLFAAFQGWLVGRFQHIFTFEFQMWVARGCVRALSTIKSFSDGAVELLTSIFTGDNVDVNAFIEDIVGDFDHGIADSNFFDTAAKIWKEEMAGVDLFAESQALGQQVNNGLQAGMGGPDNVFAKFAAEMKAVDIKEVLGAFSEEGVAATRNLERLQAKMREQIATAGMNAREITLWKLAQAGANEEEIKAARIASDHIKIQEEQAKELKKATAIMERAAATEERLAAKHKSPFEAFFAEIKELQYFLGKGMISVEAFKWEVLDAQLKLEKGLHVDFSISGMDAIRSGSKEADALIMEHRNRIQAHAASQLAVKAAMAPAASATPTALAPVRAAMPDPRSLVGAEKERIKHEIDTKSRARGREKAGDLLDTYVKNPSIKIIDPDIKALVEALRANTDKVQKKGPEVVIEPANF